MNCKELGYNVGEKFEVTSTGGHCFSDGEIVTLVDDDGSEMPRFKNNAGLQQWVYLSAVEKIHVGKTLLEILIDELPKRGGWPEGANCITQDPDHQIMPSGCHPSKAYWNGSRWNLNASRTGSFGTGEVILATDYKTSIITREQYETALAEKKEGWIQWEGGECPVEKGTLVDVKYRDGHTKENVTALSWGNGVSSIFWVNGCNNSVLNDDIVAYRLSVQFDDSECTYGDDEEAQPEKPTPKIEMLTDAIIEYGCEANLAYPLAKHLLSKGLFK